MAVVSSRKFWPAPSPAADEIVVRLKRAGTMREPILQALAEIGLVWSMVHLDNQIRRLRRAGLIEASQKVATEKQPAAPMAPMAPVAPVAPVAGVTGAISAIPATKTLPEEGVNERALENKGRDMRVSGKSEYKSRLPSSDLADAIILLERAAGRTREQINAAVEREAGITWTLSALDDNIRRLRRAGMIPVSPKMVTLQAAQAPAAPVAAATTAKSRKCLSCDGTFLSEWSGHRVCDGCRRMSGFKVSVVEHGVAARFH